MNYADLFRITLPETALEIAALVVLVVDLAFLRKSALRARAAVAAALGVVGCAAAFLFDTGAGKPDILRRRFVGDRTAGDRRAHRRGAERNSGADGADAAVADRLLLYAKSGRVCSRGADVRDRRHDHLRRAGSAGYFHWTGAAVARALRPDGVCQAIRTQCGSRAQVLPVWRHVGGVSAVRIQLSLRADRIDQPAPGGDRVHHLLWIREARCSTWRWC